MSIFQTMKQNLILRQRAKIHIVKVGWLGVIVCHFCNHRNSSMKLSDASEIPYHIREPTTK